MLYLEDYLEMIEHLPQELRDRFTEMREMDLAVQNNTDALDKRVRALFQQCRRAEISSPMADVEFDSIRTNYYRVLDDSDEKIQLAGQMYDLVERYLRRLDTELDKFKCELEADHNGITEILEKRSLELDSMTSNGGANQKENRFYDTQNAHPAGHSGRSDGGSGRYKVKAEKRRDSVAPGMSMGAAAASVEKRSAAGTSKPLSNSTLRPNTPAVLAAGGLGVAGAVAAGAAAAGGAAGPMVVGGVPGAMGAIAAGGVVGAAGAGALATVPCPQPVPVLGGAAGPGAGGVAAATYNLQTCGAGNAIVAAASQAIAQTQQMQQGRRTASLKASYEAIGGVGSHELLLNSELAGATHNALQAVERESTAFSNQRRQKKKSVNALGCGNLRTNPTMLVNASNVTSMLSSSSPNVQTLSSSPSLSSVSVHVHTSPLQQQQQQQQNQQQSPQFAAQQQQQQHQSTVQSQQLLIHANTPVSLQHGQLQPVMQQLTLPPISGMKQHLPGQQQQQQLLNQQKPVQLVSAQHRMPRQLPPQQLQQSLQAQHLQQQQLQRPQLLQQQAQQLHTVPHQQLLQTQSQQKQQLQQQQLKSVQQHATFQQAQQQQQVQSQLVQQQQQQVVQHMQQLPVQQQLLDHKDIQLQSSQQLLQQQQQQPQQVFQQQRQLLLQQQQLQQQPQLQAAQQQLLQLQNKQHGAGGQQAVQVLPQSLHQQQPFMTSVAQTSGSNATVVNVSSFMDTLMTNSGSTGGTAGTSGTSSSSTNTTAAAAAASAEPAASVDQAPEGEWFDPNEPRYCLCNQVSYGDMVACDNEDCPFEWFHYPCVNISSSPKGKWYCPQCSSSMKRRASRKN